MGFFDFLPDLPRYEGQAGPVARMNARHDMIIGPLGAELQGRRVLDLAAHDGRWTFAFAASGAAEVVGIEGRAELVETYRDFPQTGDKLRSSLRVDDIFAGMEKAIAAGERFDVVAVLGIFYHVLDHMRLLRLIRDLRPALVIIDSEFVLRNGPVIQLVRERTDKDLNAIPQYAGQNQTMIGIPSFQAMEAMAEVMGMTCDWLDWEQLPQGRRDHVADYYRTQNKRRATCLLRPHVIC